MRAIAAIGILVGVVARGIAQPAAPDAASPLSTPGSASTAPPTLRVEIVHTGGRNVEIFALDGVVVEPLPWPGHPDRSIDDGDTGQYRAEVRDAGGRLLFSRGYSTVFAEWASTAEAATTNRSIRESLRFPLPAGPVRLSVLKRDAA